MRPNAFLSILITSLLFISLYVAELYADTWQTIYPASQDLNAIWGSSESDIYVAGANNTMLHFNGSSWTHVSAVTNSTPISDLRAIWGIPGDIIITAGEQGKIFINENSIFSELTSPVLRDINGLWGASSTSAYAVGSLGTVLLFNGSSWTDATPSVTQGIDLFCVWGSAGNNIFAGGVLGKLYSFNGHSWNSVNINGISSQDFKSIWGTSSTNIYASGTYGQILHFNGSSWGLSATVDGLLAINSLWGTAANDIFAAGESGTVYHFNGSSWTRLSPPLSNDLNAIWGSTSGHVYFAGKNGVILILSRNDSISPVVVSRTLPTNSDGTVATSGAITIFFSEAMMPSTFNSTTISLKTGSTVVPAQLSLSNDGISLAITATLENSMPYTVTVSGVKDLAGNALQSNYSFSFTTGLKPGNGSGGTVDAKGCFISTARLW